MPNDPPGDKGVRNLLWRAESQLSKTAKLLEDRSQNGTADHGGKNHKKISSMDEPKSFSPAKEVPKSTNRKLDFEAKVAVNGKPTQKKARYSIISFAMMLFALLAAILLNGTCYIPFQPAHDAICPIVDRVMVSSAPIVDGVVSTLSDATHSLVEFEQDIVTRFEGQVARLQNSYPWMWRRTPTGTGVLVSLLGVENKYATSALDGLVVAGELALGAGVALWVVSKVVLYDFTTLARFFRK